MFCRCRGEVKDEPFVGGVVEVAEQPLQCSDVLLAGVLHKLTQLGDGKGDVRPGPGAEVDARGEHAAIPGLGRRQNEAVLLSLGAVFLGEARAGNDGRVCLVAVVEPGAFDGGADRLGLAECESILSLVAVAGDVAREAVIDFFPGVEV